MWEFIMRLDKNAAIFSAFQHRHGHKPFLRRERRCLVFHSGKQRGAMVKAFRPPHVVKDNIGHSVSVYLASSLIV